MTGCRKYFALLALALPGFCYAAKPYYGAKLSLPVVTTEPTPMHGAQLMVNYDPQRFQWRKFNIYFDAGYTHFYVEHARANKRINIISAAPVIRYTFNKHGPILPYFEISIGLSYMDRTRFDNRNLGMHFAFQDRFGFGAFFGRREMLSLGIHFLHYSNAHLSAHNAGITVPATFDIGFRFS